MNIEEAQVRIAQLEAELQQSKTKQIQLKVSEKGCVQINGIRKFPFTFYQDEIKEWNHNLPLQLLNASFHPN